MKKTLLLIFMVAAAVALCVNGAWAYEFTPSTEVEAYKGSGVSSYPGWTGWFPVIEDSNGPYFDIAGANLAGTTLEIFTGWPGVNPGYNYLTAVAADLFLYSAGTSWAVRLSDTTGQRGALFKNPSYNNSIYYFSPYTNDIYGGAYAPATPPPTGATVGQPVPVWATSSSTGSTTVTWGTTSTPNVYEVDVDLSKITGLDTDDFSFLYATGTCANAVMVGVVPLPPSVLLLGSGLLGLGFLGRRVRA